MQAPVLTSQAGRVVIGLGASAALSAALLRFMPESLLGAEAFPLLIIGIVLAAGLCVCSSSSAAPSYRTPLLFLWWVLLTSEEYFIRWSTSESTLQGNLSPEAYAEAAIWLSVLAAVVVLGIRNRHLSGGLFEPPLRWLTLFAVMCGASAAWSVSPSFSLAWATKLGVTVLLLAFCSNAIDSPGDLLAFVRTTFYAYVFLAIEPIFRALLDDGPMFQDGRLGNVVSPTGLSLAGGNLFLLALVLRDLGATPAAGPLAFLGLGVMILAGGKTAIVGGVVGAMLYYSLRGKVSSAFGVVAGATALAVVIVSFTPLASYLKAYSETENTTTLTGRMGLWEVGLPAIAEAPLLGHGHAASKFVSVQISGVQWDAGHMHNGFLEAAYNNGIPGMLLVLAINFILVRNFVHVLRTTVKGSSSQILAAGGLALYVNLFINGMFNAVFGGRTNAPFMLLMALVVISTHLRARKSYASDYSLP